THPSHHTSSFYLTHTSPHTPHHSFPTRRSSDLSQRTHRGRGGSGERSDQGRQGQALRSFRGGCEDDTSRPRGPASHRATERILRSEEHTSELQSRSDLVCRLLLEKKKKHNIIKY